MLLRPQVSSYLNSLKGGYRGDSIGDYSGVLASGGNLVMQE